MSDDLLLKYLEHLKFRCLSPQSIESRRDTLRVFRRYAHEVLSKKLKDVTSKDIEKYLSQVKPRLKDSTFVGRVSILKNFYIYLKKESIILQNPFEVLDPVPRWDRTPRDVPDEKTVEHLLTRPDGHTYIGIRDQAILELLYSTGIRNKEFLQLRLQDLDLKEHYLLVFYGKGGKQRMVPFGKKAKEAVERYLEVTRPHFQKNPNEDHLFLSEWGNSLKEWAVCELIKRYADKSNHTKRITSHSLRHACALHMLKGGAPIEVVQELLGHKQLATTQIYTRLLPQDLKAVHEKFHPRERQKEV